MFSTSLTVRLRYWHKKNFFVSIRVKNHSVQADFALWVWVLQFPANQLLQVQDKASIEFTHFILVHVGFFLFWNFDSYTLFLLCHNNIWCHHALLQQYIWHKLCNHHHLGPYLLLQFACTSSFAPGELSPIQVVSCAVADSLSLSLHEQSIFSVCKGIDIHMHTVLLIPTVHNHLVEVIFYLTNSIQTGPCGPMKCTSISIH